MTHTVYIIECRDKTLYVGHTHNLPQRIDYHMKGKGSLHLAHRGYNRLIYSETVPDEKSAIRRERQIKQWSRAKKLALAIGNLDRLKELSRSRN